MLEFLRHRIGDPRVIRLIARMLKAGILEDGLVQATEEGTPQGSFFSPTAANMAPSTVSMRVCMGASRAGTRSTWSAMPTTS